MKKLNAQSALPFVLLAVYLLLILTHLIPSEVMDSTVKLFFALIILELLVFALPIFLYSRMQERDYIKELPFHFFPSKFTPFLVSMGFLMLAGGLVINSLFYFLGFGSASYASLGSFILSDVSIDSNPLYVLLAYGALPALCEEVLFRGILIHEYKKYSFPTAAIISSLAYAFCYFDLSLLFPQRLDPCLYCPHDRLAVCRHPHPLCGECGIGLLNALHLGAPHTAAWCAVRGLCGNGALYHLPFLRPQNHRKALPRNGV